MLAGQLGVTPMAVTYRAGNKKQLMSDLVELAFEGILDGVEDGTSTKRARSTLATYFGHALKNTYLLRAILTQTSDFSDPIHQSIRRGRRGEIDESAQSSKCCGQIERA